MKYTTLILIIIATISFACKKSGNDNDFVISASKATKAEGDLAQDAMSAADDAEVRTYAQKLVFDHTNLDAEVERLARNKDVKVPGGVEGKVKEAKVQLMKLTGKSFDQAFVKQMFEDHIAMIRDFEEESRMGSDRDVRAWADKTLLTLRQHLKTAEELQAKVGK